MNILIFTWKDLGIPDVCDALEKLGCTYRCKFRTNGVVIPLPAA